MIQGAGEAGRPSSLLIERREACSWDQRAELRAPGQEKQPGKTGLQHLQAPARH